MRNILLLLFISLLSQTSRAQITQSGNLVEYLNAKIDNMPGQGTDVYQDPVGAEAEVFEIAIQKLDDEDFQSAHESFQLLGYQLVAFTDNSTSRIYYIVEEPSTAENPTYGGTYVFCPSCSVENIVLQAPHGVKDASTGKQSIQVYYDLEGQWLMFNSSHRCNSAALSSCSGTTSVCGGGSNPYPVSDAAHNDNSWMQAATKALDEMFINDEKQVVFIQPHGFNKDSRPADFPDGILSYGTRTAPNSENDPALLFKEAMEEACDCVIDLYHDSEVDELGGTTNTQGRYLNQSPDPCEEKGTINSSKFLHYEQSAALREDFSLLLAGLQSFAEVTPTNPEVPLGLATELEPALFVHDGRLHMQLEDVEYKAQVRVYSTDGKILLHTEVTKNQTIDFSNHGTGIFIYLLELENGESYRGKFVR